MAGDETGNVRRLIAQFKEHLLAAGHTDSTVRSYVYEVKAFFRYLETSGGPDDVTAITADHMHRYQMHLYNATTPKGTPLSRHSQRNALVAVRRFFVDLMDRGRILGDPSRRLELPSAPKRLPQGIMTHGEIRKVLRQPDVETPRGFRDRTILELLYSTGVRNSELRNLRVQDVDVQNREVRVRLGKGRKDRVVPLGEVAARYADEYIRRERPEFVRRRGAFFTSRRFRPGAEDPDRDLLFYGWRGRKLSVWTLDQAVSRSVAKARLKKHVTPHGFRHTFATHMLKGRAGLRHIQEILGHASLASTQLYTHVEIGDLKREHRKCHPRERSL